MKGKGQNINKINSSRNIQRNIAKIIKIEPEINFKTYLITYSPNPNHSTNRDFKFKTLGVFRILETNFSLSARERSLELTDGSSARSRH
jgi:hypothetical protein